VSAQDKWDAMMALPGPAIDVEVVRVTIEEGRTFSADAMEDLNESLMAWVGTRVMRRWEATHEPPSALRVTVTVEVS
jgi:hypothetical protein